MTAPIPLYEVRAKVAEDLRLLEEAGPGPNPNDIARHVHTAREAELRSVLRFIDRVTTDTLFPHEMAELREAHRKREWELKEAYARYLKRSLGVR